MSRSAKIRTCLHHPVIDSEPAGCEVVVDGEFTGERPGIVLRAGRDTETATLADITSTG